jgi:hypothetical protein
MLTQQLTAIAADFTHPDAIEALNTIYADPDNTPELIKAAFIEVNRSLQARLRDIFLDREALGGFRVGDRVMIRSESANCEPDINDEVRSFEICLYPSLKGTELIIDSICYPYLACKRPSGSDTPGLLKTDLVKT